ncbi:MAG: Eco57I restriction-modification methylase domain-containing protein [Methanomicrobium sp.]|nr:Eco57I restriction-modification methylase domain-containing protein [Methanomicrobium sp.]
MKFDFCIGNPPYQQESVGANANDTPIYHYFFDAAVEIAEKVELITPARFLFDVGGTPKKWNEKMLNNEHFMVEKYYENAGDVFPNTEIKGGVAVSYIDKTKKFGAIRMFTPYPELNSILKKIGVFDHSMSDIITNRGSYRYSDLAYEKEPVEMKKTSDRRIAPSCFERMPKLFTDEKPNDGEYIKIIGVQNGVRKSKWFKKEYVAETKSLNQYKILISKANGNGIFGETLTAPILCVPGEGFTETFIAVGIVDTKNEAKHIEKYIKTKFARAMLGVLKVTQNMSRDTWKYVPLQDFSANSDIDWSKSIHEIDQQLYKKYGLSKEEIDFIETRVKEMA